MARVTDSSQVGSMAAWQWLAWNPGSLSWGKREPGTHCLRMCQESQEFRFFCKNLISHILLHVLNLNCPLHYCLFQLDSYLPHLLVSTITETLGAHYFCLGKALARAVESRNFKKYEQDLHVAIGDSVGLHKSSGLFKVLDLASLFHIYITLF